MNMIRRGSLPPAARCPRAAFLVVAVLVVVGASAAGAAEIFVAPDGDDAAPGTRARPLASIQTAVDRARPGDTVIIRGGTYRETVRLKTSGTKAAGATAERVALVARHLDPLEAEWTRHDGRIYKAAVAAHPRQLFCDGLPLTPARWPEMPWAGSSPPGRPPPQGPARWPPREA